jgi:hypothetical protein
MHIFRNIAIVFFILFGCASLPAQTNRWNLVAKIPEDSLSSPQLFFADSIHGYLLAFKPYNLANQFYENFILYRTIDGGKTWQKIDFHTILGADTALYSDNFLLRFYAASPNSCVISNAENVIGFSQTQDTLTFYWSENNGTSWFPTRTSHGTNVSDYLIEAAPHDHEIIALRINNDDPSNSTPGQFGVSATNGAIFDDIRWDSTLLGNILIENFDYHGEVNNHSFDYFDDSTWIITVSDNNNAEYNDPTKPYSLVTLLAKEFDNDADPGKYWEAYKNIIPYYPSSLLAKYFDMHCVRGTSYVYLFSGYGGQGQYPFFGINYLYSSDYGVSWNADSSFAINSRSYRRAYAASAPAEVWSSVIPFYLSDIYPNTPAIWIAHSTNFGKTWDIDSSSLHINENQYYDGQVMTFSDKNHGWMFAQSVKGQGSAIFRYEGITNAVRAIPQESSTHFSIYPNPAGNETTIHSSNDHQISSIEIFDVLGRKQSCQYEIKNEPSSAILKTNELLTGSYFARIRNSYGINIMPFVVQH